MQRLCVEARVMTRRKSTEKRHKRIRSRVRRRGGGRQATAQPAACCCSGCMVVLCMCWMEQRWSSRGSHGCPGCWRAGLRPLYLTLPACPPACLKVEGTPERPRLAVFRSNTHIYAQARTWAGRRAAAVCQPPRPCRVLPRLACRRRLAPPPSCPLTLAHHAASPAALQVIDDSLGHTLAATSTLSPDIRTALTDGGGANVEAAKLVGAKIAELCKQKNIEKVGAGLAG